MASADSASGSYLGRAAHFATTHWSVVLAAGEESSPDSDHALGQLCQSYWYPLYAFARRQGHSPSDAQDLTQGFFAQLLEKKYLARADPKRGRFRSFLLASLKHYLANEWDRQHAQKRGGQSPQLSFDEVEAENRFVQDSRAPLTPEMLFDRQWALTVLDQALARLRSEFVSAGKGAVFNVLKTALTGEADGLAYAESAARLQMSEGSIKVTVHRMRQRFRELIRAEIAQTLIDASQVDEEMHHLLSALTPV
jgi:RNA polymerase sigma-70 factor (ECF subfamily)